MSAFNKDTLITLISFTSGEDADGFPTDEQEDTSDVWAQITSISRDEFYQAGQRNLKPEIRAIVWVSEYEGQDTVDIDGVRYGVYRTYRQDYSDEIELYLEKKAGDVLDPEPEPEPGDGGDGDGI